MISLRAALEIGGRGGIESGCIWQRMIWGIVHRSQQNNPSFGVISSHSLLYSIYSFSSWVFCSLSLPIRWLGLIRLVAGSLPLFHFGAPQAGRQVNVKTRILPFLFQPSASTLWNDKLNSEFMNSEWWDHAITGYWCERYHTQCMAQ